MLPTEPPLPCLAFVAPSGTGKTTLLAAVIRRLVAEGLCVAALKGTHHEIRLDVPGKDSFKLKEAGAAAVGLIGPETGTFFLGPDPARALDERARLLEVLAWFGACPLFPFDLVLVEGFASVREIPKLRVVRGAWPEEGFAGMPEGVVAVAWDGFAEGREPADLPAEVVRLPREAGAVARWLSGRARRGAAS